MCSKVCAHSVRGWHLDAWPPSTSPPWHSCRACNLISLMRISEGISVEHCWHLPTWLCQAVFTASNIPQRITQSLHWFHVTPPWKCLFYFLWFRKSVLVIVKTTFFDVLTVSCVSFQYLKESGNEPILLRRPRILKTQPLTSHVPASLRAKLMKSTNISTRNMQVNVPKRKERDQRRRTLMICSLSRGTCIICVKLLTRVCFECTNHRSVNGSRNRNSHMIPCELW